MLNMVHNGVCMVAGGGRLRRSAKTNFYPLTVYRAKTATTIE
jgi:hypothetical protein